MAPVCMNSLVVRQGYYAGNVAVGLNLAMVDGRRARR